MDNVKDILKKYWPYIVGGIVGLYLIMRYSGGSSSSGGSDYGAFLQAQTAAAAQNANLQAQSNAQSAQLQAQSAAQNAALKLQQDQQNNQMAMAQSQLSLQQQALTGEMALQTAALADARAQAADKNKLDTMALNNAVVRDNNSLELQRMATQANAFNQFTTAQAAMAQSVGSSTAAVIDALNKPALVAMQSNAAENAASLQASANVAAAGFLAQSGMVAGNSNIAGGLAQSIGNLQIPNVQGGQQQGKVGQALEYGGRAVAAYYTMGGSEVARSSYY